MLIFALSEEMVDIIGKSLGKQPYEIVAPVVAELQKQINQQQEKKAAETPEGPSP